jgi:transcriptional regulator with XRE-family HTH domain
MPRHHDPQVGLARAIRKLRTDGELTQEELGFRAEIHPTWISRIESGDINPTWGNARRIAAGLYVPLPDLATLAEEFEQRAAS